MYPTYFDAHCDTASVLCDRQASLWHNDGYIALDKLKNYDAPILCFAAYIAPEYAKNGYQHYRDIVDYFKHQLQEQKEHISFCRTGRDVKLAQKNNKVCAFLTVEGGEAIDGDLAKLNDLARDGVRAMTLTWNFDNDLATGCATKAHHGLTAKGKEAVQRLNELSILPDVSHASAQTFWDILATSTSPIIASHSNSKAVYNDAYGRNISDEQFLALCQKGGVCGVNIYPPFLKEGEADVLDVVRHIEHFLGLGGEDHVGFGFDFDGIDKTPRGMRHAGDVIRLMNELSNLGYSDQLLQKIFWKNFLRVFSE